uniref:Butyrophilin n=1 Tax=Chelonoidis abingdonii TaxID=106734 RepID=A0A8C0GD32_CHEAB
LLFDLIYFLSMTRFTAQFTVTGPDRPITASVGGEAVLPCHLSPRISAQSMEVRWVRSQHSAVVHLYQDGQDRYENQMFEYQGRTELLKDHITNGSVSLRIRDIQPSDEGQYTCLFQSLTFFQDASMLLQVEGLGSGPDISVEGHQDGGIKVVCRSSGWYPQPEAQWRDLQGQLLPSASENISREANGLFQAEIAILITEDPLSLLRRLQAQPVPGPKQRCWGCSFPWHLDSLYLGQMAGRGGRDLLRHKPCAAPRGQSPARAGQRSAQLDVTLDPNTANPYLILSGDRKCVTHRDEHQDLPDNPERFDTMAVVLGAEGFTGGRHYWEVEVGEKNIWTLGVCREDVSRKGHILFVPENGYWTIWQHADQLMANTSPTTFLPVSVRPRRLGIFLDYEAGEISFYNVTDRSHLFTFTNTFSGVLRPYFNPEYNKGGTNMFPLIICPVPAQAGGSLCP